MRSKILFFKHGDVQLKSWMQKSSKRVFGGSRERQHLIVQTISINAGHSLSVSASVEMTKHDVEVYIAFLNDRLKEFGE